MMRPTKAIGPQTQGQGFRTHTFGKEVFPTIYHFNSGLESKCVFRAAGEKPPGNKLIDALVIASEITSVGSWVDGWVSLVVILASARLGEATLVLKTR
jgi:hypothetical protein